MRDYLSHETDDVTRSVAVALDSIIGFMRAKTEEQILRELESAVGAGHEELARTILSAWARQDRIVRGEDPDGKPGWIYP